MSLQIRKLDLHVHTPASHDFREQVSLEEIIKTAKAKGLDGIAITDHNTVSAIDEAVMLGRQYGIAVFPGVEISCHGSKEGPIHVIGIFDPSKSQTYLERVLGKLDIRKEGEDSITPKSVSDVIDIIRSCEGLPILAHANSTHGALSDIRGNPRTELVQNSNLLAAEATDGDFAKPRGERLIDYLNGDDPKYKRKLAVYCASDNLAQGASGHSAGTIGSRFTCFRMGEFTAESLRQCFEDPDARIVQSSEVDKLKSQQPQLLSVTVDGGFLAGMTVSFHPGMNSIIGGTGTGKSLLVEFLRFAFGKPPHGSLAREYQDKLEKQLKERGSVTVRLLDSSGDEYEVSRIYSARKPAESPIQCKNVTTGEVFDGEIASLFPVLFYSQNEILEVTRDSEAQLDLLDNFRDFGRYRQEIARITGELKRRDRIFTGSYEQAEDLPGLQKQDRTLAAQIAKCEKQIKANAKKEFGEFSVLDQRRNAAVERLGILDELGEVLEQAVEKIGEQSVGLAANPKSLDSPLSEIEEIARDTYRTVGRLLDKASKAAAGAQQKAQRQIGTWERGSKYSRRKAAYDTAVRAKSQLATLETQRRKLIEQRDDLRARMTTATNAAKTKSAILSERVTLLDELQRIRAEYYAERKEQADLITERSGEKLRINVLEKADNKRYRENLLKLKVKSYAEEKEIDSIITNVPVITFVDLVFERNTAKLAKAAGLSQAKAESIVNVLLQPENLAGTLALQHDSFPEDRIEILYRKQDGSYRPLPELSMGQKADALLMIALGDSQMPVVIDQPEDALDLSSIWDDICERLRMSKHSRQFVFTTHNSSVAVASDSDQYIVMEADANRGWVADTGSIDELGIKRKVVDHLEGGAKSYQLKRKKYNM